MAASQEKKNDELERLLRDRIPALPVGSDPQMTLPFPAKKKPTSEGKSK